MLKARAMFLPPRHEQFVKVNLSCILSESREDVCRAILRSSHALRLSIHQRS